jgi:hypothetical protein
MPMNHEFKASLGYLARPCLKTNLIFISLIVIVYIYGVQCDISLSCSTGDGTQDLAPARQVFTTEPQPQPTRTMCDDLQTKVIVIYHCRHLPSLCTTFNSYKSGSLKSSTLCVCVCVCVCVSLGFELRAYTLNHSTSPFL